MITLITVKSSRNCWSYLEEHRYPSNILQHTEKWLTWLVMFISHWDSIPGRTTSPGLCTACKAPDKPGIALLWLLEGPCSVALIHRPLMVLEATVWNAGVLGSYSLPCLPGSPSLALGSLSCIWAKPGYLWFGAAVSESVPLLSHNADMSSLSHRCLHLTVSLSLSLFPDS